MKDILKTLENVLLIASVACVIYLLFSFAQATFIIALWAAPVRVLCALIMAIVIVLTIAYL